MEIERFITSFDGTRIFTNEAGEGTPLLLFDGLGCDGFIWRYIKPMLSKKYRVIHFHYRGHGLSGRPVDPDALGVPALCADARAVLDAYEVESAVLFGHSMGVQVIFDFALHHPERVRGLVPICGSYGRPLDTLHGDNRAASIFPIVRDLALKFPEKTQRLWRRLLISRLALRFSMLFEVNGRILRERDFAPYFEHLAGMDAQVFVHLLDRLQNHSVEDRLGDIHCPTLVIAGERDTFTPVWLSHRMQMMVPGAELLVVPGGSHVAPIEIPELLALRLQRFFSEKIDASQGPPHKNDEAEVSRRALRHASQEMAV